MTILYAIGILLALVYGPTVVILAVGGLLMAIEEAYNNLKSWLTFN